VIVPFGGCHFEVSHQTFEYTGTSQFLKICEIPMVDELQDRLIPLAVGTRPVQELELACGPIPTDPSPRRQR
jgi:hypothetical protein